VTFDAWLESRGFAPEDLTPAQRTALQADHEASQKPQPEPTPAPRPADAPPARAEDTLDQILARTRAENDRRAKITELVAGYLQKDPSCIAQIEAIGRAAIDGTWTVQRAELEMLRTVRSNGGPVVHVPSAPQVTAEVYEAAVARAGGLQNIEKHYGERVLSVVDKKFRHGLGLKGLIESAARANGYRDASCVGDMRGTLRAAFRDRADYPAGPRADVAGSTMDVPGILSNVANKFLETGVPLRRADVAARFRPDQAQSVTLSTITSYRLTGAN
jgi:hypothetical protein